MVSTVVVKRTLLFSAVFIVLVTSFQNCGYVGQSDPGSFMLSSQYVTYDDVREKVFVPYCLSCHQGVTPSGNLDLSTFTGALQSVVPYDPANSILSFSIRNGSMPPAPAPVLSQADMDLVANWILSGAPESATGPMPTPVPTATPAPTATPVPTATPASMATFTYINNNILVTKCLGCHASPAPMGGGYSYSTYATTLSSVVAGNAAASPLYTAVLNNSMPKNGPALSAAEKTAIQNWINAGAQNN